MIMFILIFKSKFDPILNVNNTVENIIQVKDIIITF